MIDFGRIVGFEWDEGNRHKSLAKHGITEREAEQVFTDPLLLVFVDRNHSGEEERFHAYGETADGRRLQVAFTVRENATMLRVISARDMSRRERARYDEEA